jgi:hypothetical protein
MGSTVWVASRPHKPIFEVELPLQGVPDSFLDVWARYLSIPYVWLRNPTINGAADALASMIGVIAIWSFVGGCISRRSVLELGANITSTWEDCIRLVLKRWQSIAWSTTMPIALILLISIVPLMLGWLSNVPWIGTWLVGLLMIPIVIGALGIGWCAAISVLAFPLSVCGVVTEKQADAFDGISRSAAYTFQRPLTLALCVLAAQGIGIVGGSILSLVLSTGYSVIQVAFETGSAWEIATMNPLWSGILTGIVPLLILSYSFSLFWTASAASYLLLRKDVDHAEFDTIDMAATSEPKPLPDLPKREVAVSSDASET